MHLYIITEGASPVGLWEHYITVDVMRYVLVHSVRSLMAVIDFCREMLRALI